MPWRRAVLEIAWQPTAASSMIPRPMLRTCGSDPMVQPASHAKLGGLLLLAGVAACFLMDAPGDGGPRFSHEIHGEDKGLHCVNCHSGAYASDSAGLPGPQLCRPCHDRRDEADLPPEYRLDAQFEEDGRFKAQHLAQIPDEVRFSHGRHAEAGVSCADCHGDAGTSEVLPSDAAVSKDACLSCHAERGARNDCGACHIQINKDWLPDSHAHAWDLAHGKVVRARDPAVSNRCSLCHEPASCQSCHRENMPVSHTNFWRLRGHGVMVSLDRSRCSTCHRTDFCIRCHENTRPRSHTAGWGFPRERHCTVCHYPLRSTSCITCHKSTPGHMQATPLPPGHLPSMNCRQCHGSGAPLPHPDNGQQCTICHR